MPCVMVSEAEGSNRSIPRQPTSAPNAGRHFLYDFAPSASVLNQIGRPITINRAWMESAKHVSIT
jgi:hypothetical protein